MSHSLRYALFNWGSQSEKTGFEESRQNKSEGALLSWLLVVIHYRDSSVWRDHLPRACKKSCTAAFYPPAAIPHWSLPTSPGYTCVVGTGPTASLHSATTKELPKSKYSNSCIKCRWTKYSDLGKVENNITHHLGNANMPFHTYKHGDYRKTEMRNIGEDVENLGPLPLLVGM